MSCVIVGCKSHSSRNENKDENISFHRFPTDDTMRQKWIDIIARTNWHWKKQHRICSRHFNIDCFINIDYKWRRLKTTAVPSLHLQSAMNVVPTTLASFDAIPTPTVPTSSSFSILSIKQQIDLIKQVSKLEKDNQWLKKLARQRFLKVNALRQKTNRLKKKYIDLNNRLMDVLKNERTKTENLL